MTLVRAAPARQLILSELLLPEVVEKLETHILPSSLVIDIYKSILANRPVRILSQHFICIAQYRHEGSPSAVAIVFPLPVSRVRW